MISVIDMPHADESLWWRGKRGFDVGFFPCECVEVIAADAASKAAGLPTGLKVYPTAAAAGGGKAVEGLTTPGGGGVGDEDEIMSPVVVGGSGGGVGVVGSSESSSTTASESSASSSSASSGGGHQPSKPVLRKHGKLISFFRSFILNRPNRGKLKKSGILKERVFGCDLSEHLLNTGQPGK